MPELTFRVDGVEPERFAVVPQLLFHLRISETIPPGAQPTPIHSILLRCQLRIEPGRRRYDAEEQEQLLEVFDVPERWSRTLRPLLWTHVNVVVPEFHGTCAVDLPVPCSYDFSLAATKYFAALKNGDLPLCFLFSGTIFHEGEEGALQVAQVPWEKEASYRLPARTWHELMELYYPNSAWLCVRRDVFDLLRQYKSHQGLPTWEQTFERLLATAENAVTP
jgi:hypothetical protein